jgi:preprotein translocase subunit Sss1
MPRTARAVRSETERARSLAEIEAIAWLLDNSIPVPGTGGRRFGIDALIGLVPGIGDLLSGAIGLVVVWRGSRMGVPRVVVARMLANTLLDLAIGSIPVIGDAFDLWFKASTRNLALVRGWLERPDRSTRGEWVAVLALVGAVVAVVGLVGWLVLAAIASLIGAIS